MGKQQPSKIKKRPVDLTGAIDSLKADMGLIATSYEEREMSSAEKELDWIVMPQGFQDAVRLNIPIGYVSVVKGWQETGKSTIINAIIASCMRQGIIPIIYDTENNFDFSYAIACGMQAKPITQEVEEEAYDEETGEVTGTQKVTKVIDYSGDFFYFNSYRLAMKYGDWDYSAGKASSKKRKTAVMEDVARSMNEFLDLQEEGKIKAPICFLWDSYGSIESYRSWESKVRNPMWDAGAFTYAFSTVFMDRIPGSRRIGSEYTNTVVYVNQIREETMMGMPGVPSTAMLGGKAARFRPRLIFHLGGVAKSATKRLTMTAKGEKISYGIITRIKTEKNELKAPYNLSSEGEFACVHCGIIPADDKSIDEYKKTHMKYLLELMEKERNAIGVSENDVTFSEEEIES